jgi:SAM-dependent methyltransferase
LARSFEEVVAEGEAEPVEGWDFSWFEGRATEERPSWGYLSLLVERIDKSHATLDVQTGGGEVFAEALSRTTTVPPKVAATESWPPNVEVARRNLSPFAVDVIEVADDPGLPFDACSFDLIVSRHPTVVVWEQILRVLEPGGTYFSQQIGPGSNRELTEFMMGPQPVSDRRPPETAVANAAAAGLEVVDLQQQELEVRFFDVGAVVYFLRKVLWTVPGFSVDRYADRLKAMDQSIRQEGSFLSHSQRFLIEARRPD